jgi:hypothetical protein
MAILKSANALHMNPVNVFKFSVKFSSNHVLVYLVFRKLNGDEKYYDRKSRR